MSRYLALLLFPLFACQSRQESVFQDLPNLYPDSLRILSDIALPRGYKRVPASDNTFAGWLRDLPVRKDPHVYLYDGRLKRNQTAQFAVLDISVGKKDLQQCADAVMRLRAEYLFSQKRYSEIVFRDNAGKSYRWTGANNRAAFDRYLETVFSYCNSASLENQLTPVVHSKDIQAGDVLIKGGFPGHAMIVTDVATNSDGNKIYMLAQSYMPAQDIHIVRNPLIGEYSPWYYVSDDQEIVTPEWTFTGNRFRRW